MNYNISITVYFYTDDSKFTKVLFDSTGEDSLQLSYFDSFVYNICSSFNCYDVSVDEVGHNHLIVHAIKEDNSFDIEIRISNDIENFIENDIYREDMLFQDRRHWWLHHINVNGYCFDTYNDVVNNLRAAVEDI